MMRSTLWILAGMGVVSSLVVPAARAWESKDEVTFREVRPLLEKHCQGCHRPGQIAPMSLMTYEQTRPWAESIKENVVKRIMPPWHADPRFGTFDNDRRLSEEELATLVAWVDSGAPRGDLSGLPPQPEPSDGWSIGEPDAVYAMEEEYEVGPEGLDEYIYFAIPTHLTGDRYVKAVEIRPGNRAVVHHVLAYVQPGGSGTVSRADVDHYNKAVGFPMFLGEGDALRVRPDAPIHDDACSLEDGGSALSMDMTRGRRKLLTSYVPGARGDVWGKGLGKLIPAGSEILFQVHYNRTGQVERDRTSVGVIFSDERPEKTVEAYWVSNYYFRIPPDASAHEVKGCYTFDRNVQILSFFPHMHLRGKDMRIEALYPDGAQETLLNVPRYDFNWQTNYVLATPKPVPAGTRIVVTAHFDNSKRNIYNPDSSLSVRWGDATNDEMMIGGVDYIVAGEGATEN